MEGVPCSFNRLSHFSIVAAFCGASLMLITQATTALSRASVRPTAESSALVNRAANPIVWCARERRRAQPTRSPSNSLVHRMLVIRDRRGFILFAVDHWLAQRLSVNKVVLGRLCLRPRNRASLYRRDVREPSAPMSSLQRPTSLVDACRQSITARCIRDAEYLARPVAYEHALIVAYCTLFTATSDHQSRPRKSGQDDRWSFCLTAGTLCPSNQEIR